MENIGTRNFRAEIISLDCTFLIDRVVDYFKNCRYLFFDESRFHTSIFSVFLFLILFFSFLILKRFLKGLKIISPATPLPCILYTVYYPIVCSTVLAVSLSKKTVISARNSVMDPTLLSWSRLSSDRHFSVLWIS